MNDARQLVVFRLNDQRYALPLMAVERIVRAAELTPLPCAPAIVLGAIDVAGNVLPALNVRRRFRLPELHLTPTQQFLIAKSDRRSVVLVIDEALGVIEASNTDIVPADDIAPRLAHISGTVKLADGLVLIHDLESFLSLEEEDTLDQALTVESHESQ
jgi:purine-binding chemotaxis protein CheW